MKNTLRITRIELANLFLSPVAWLVLLAFLVQGSLELTSHLERFVQAARMGQALSSLTEPTFAGFAGLFPKMQDNLYLYIPLLTMGLISREVNSGSIKLLYSSPIRVSQIVWGKYLAMLVYCFLLISSLLLLGGVGLVVIRHADWGLILSGVLGLYLQICAYAAIGLFMSSLTTYQVVAAISTLVVLAALKFVGGLWQDLDFVRDITYFLSLNGRTSQFIEGLVSSKDVSYFLLVIVLFVGLTIARLQGGRESTPWYQKAGRYAAILTVVLALGYVSSRPWASFYYDLTATKTQTLTPNSQAVIRQFDEPVTVTTYVNLLDENYFNGLPMSRNIDLRRFEQYVRFLPDLQTNYVYYYDHSQNEALYKQNPGLSDKQLAEKMAVISKLDFQDFASPAEIKKVIDLAPEQNRFVRVLRYKDRETHLRVYNDLQRFPAERELTAAFKRLLGPAPRVAYISGHQERSIERAGDRDYKTLAQENSFRYSLINQGFDVLATSLQQPIAPQVSIVVLADPQQPFTAPELAHLQAYLDRGGDLLLAAEPATAPLLAPVLAMLGVQPVPGQLVQQSRDYAPNFVLANLSKQAPDLIFGKNRGLYKADIPVALPGALGFVLQPQGPFAVTPILVTDAATTWATTTPPPTGNNQPLADTRPNASKRSVPVALALTRQQKGKVQKILVFGDSDFMSNAELVRQAPRTLNFNFALSLFSWFTDGQFPIDTTRPIPQDDGFNIDHQQLAGIKWGLVGLLPALTIGGVALMLMRRKRR